MKRRFEIYAGDKAYMTPAGTMATPEMMYATYPALSHFAHIVETDNAGEVLYALLNLSAERTRLGIDPSLTPEEAVTAIEQAYHERDNVVREPRAEERIAAMLEFQAMMAMPDEEE